MENKKPTRASQARKSDSTKVETQAKTVAPKERPKVWTPPSYLDTPNADEYPEEDFPVVADGKYAGVIGHGGLVLTRVPEEIAQQRTEYYMKQAQDQQAAIDADLAKEQHKSMPINVDRDTRVTFGGSKKS